MTISKSKSATPILNLVRDLQLVGLHDFAKRAMKGEFDATKEEAVRQAHHAPRGC